MTEQNLDDRLANQEFFWYSGRLIADIDPNHVEFAHIISGICDGETPGGTSCKNHTAYCGEECEGYSINTMRNHYGKIEDVLKARISICPGCLGEFGKRNQ